MDRGAAMGSPIRAWIVPSAVVLALLVALALTIIDPEASETVGALGVMLGSFTAVGLIISRSKSLEGRERTSWRFFAFALLLAGVGVLVVGVLTESGIELPAFGPVDVFFLGGYAMLVVTLVRLARIDAGDGQWAVTLLDASVGAIALAALTWTAFFHQLVDSFEGAPWWEGATAATYPILDIAAIVALMILVIRRSNYHLDLRLVFIAVGLAMQVLADFSYLSRGIGRTFEEAQPVFPLLVAASICWVIAGALVHKTPPKREFPESATPIWALVWPYLLAGALLGVHVARYRDLNPSIDETILLDAVLAVGAVIFLRQVVVIHRNRVQVEDKRSELIASVSHELRTPLTAMVGYLTLLDEEPDDFPEDARREMISEATNEARHMSRLVSDLLMLARGSQRPLTLEYSDTELSSLVSATMRTTRPDRTKIEAKIIHDAPVRVDADRVQQALGNLLGNAVRYGGESALLVAMTDGEDLVLEVHDDGPGVPTRYERVIWQRFERGAHRLDATTPGLGIGLSIVQAVANSHGGRASYGRSTRLGGACFAIRIPGCVLSSAEPSRRLEISS